MIEFLAVLAALGGLALLLGSKAVARRTDMLPETVRIIGVGLLLVGAIVLWAPG
jgi:uncharacterized protein YjeT (DUF2065 family)